MDKLERKIKCKLDIYRFMEFLRKIEIYCVVAHILNDIRLWICLYEKDVNTDSQDVKNFISHIKTINNILSDCGTLIVLRRKRDLDNSYHDITTRNSLVVIDTFWNEIFNNYCDLNECYDFVEFLNRIKVDQNRDCSVLSWVV